jgi:hypothetical protein
MIEQHQPSRRYGQPTSGHPRKQARMRDADVVGPTSK